VIKILTSNLISDIKSRCGAVWAKTHGLSRCFEGSPTVQRLERWSAEPSEAYPHNAPNELRGVPARIHLGPFKVCGFLRRRVKTISEKEGNDLGSERGCEMV
jgi:hypothetical protein